MGEQQKMTIEEAIAILDPETSRALAEKKIDRPATEAIDKTQYRINVDESTGEIINFPGEMEAEQ